MLKKRGKKSKSDSTEEITEYDILSGLNDKASIHIKTTPNKDARTTAKLSVRSGVISKRNEQGNWQSRFVCLVPHTFLYYFEDEKAESPRGIIDLEMYTNLSIEGNDILKISTNNLHAARSFFLKADDPDLLNEWISSIHQDRFMQVRDERDAYKQLQDQFSGEINSHKEKFETSALDKAKMEEELQLANSIASGALNVMKKVLVRFGIPEHEMAKIESPTSAGDCLQQNIDKLRLEFDRNIKITTEKHEMERAELQKQIDDLKDEVTRLQQDRIKQDSLITQIKNECDQRMREGLIEIEKANMNVQIAVNAKTISENKAAALTDQKKVLIKEVKQLRSKLDQTSDSLTHMKELNDRLNAALTNMKEFSKVQAVSSQSQSQSQSSPPIHSTVTTSVTVDYSTTSQNLESQQVIDSVTPNEIISNDILISEAETTLSDDKIQVKSPVIRESLLDANRDSISASGNEVEKDIDIDEWDLPNVSLNEFQENLVKPNATSPALSLQEKSIDFFSPLKQTILKNEVLKPVESPPVVSSKEEDEIFKTDFFSSPFTVKAERLPSAMRLTCLRCNGTVEGPKYSTCKCTQPALTAEDLHKGGSSIMGMLSKGLVSFRLGSSSAAPPNSNKEAAIAQLDLLDE